MGAKGRSIMNGLGGYGVDPKLMLLLVIVYIVGVAVAVSFVVTVGF